MIFLWSTSDRIGSKLIRWGREDDCSHFSVCWDGIIEDVPEEHWLVTESRFGSGVKADWLGVVQRKNSITHALKVDIKTEVEQSYYCEYIKEMGGKQYDADGIWFLALLTLAQKVGLGATMKNPWASRNKVFCTETVKVFEPLFQSWGIALPKLELLDPHDLYATLCLSDHFTEIAL